ncbi:MAG: MBL fold metallo-hydrolase [Crenarchaeota archaeon]|nr:MBL fold metallo-hydrolase [Thermoproteota archaeon]
MRLIVVVDNEPGPGLLSEWGLSIYVDLGDRAIIFDTGASEEVFKYNFRSLGLSMDNVIACAISHEHGDHTGGLGAVVEYCHRVPIYLPSPSRLAHELIGLCKVHVNSEVTNILSNVYLINFPRSFIPEQCMVIDLGMWLVMITGCSHPGIVHMVRQVMGMFKKAILLLIGGFHLYGISPGDAVLLADKFCRMQGLFKICPLHCTGRTFQQALRSTCPEKYVPGHSGAIINVEEDGTVTYSSPL